MICGIALLSKSNGNKLNKSEVEKFNKNTLVTAYLDNNILVSIEAGEINPEELKNIYGKGISFVYSYVHIQELLKGEKNIKELVEKRIQTICAITNKTYVYPDIRGISFKTEYPENVISFIQMNFKLMEAIKTAAKNFRVDRTALINHIGVDLKRINNYEPEEVVEYLNNAIQKNLQLGFTEIIDLAGTSLRDRINTLFNLLDFVGFWKDKKNEKSDLARLYDASHAYFASGCDFFITNDKRALKKTKVAFYLNHIDTKVMSFQEFTNLRASL